MTLPLLSYAPRSQSIRVNGFEIPGDEQPKVYSTQYVLAANEIEEVIEAAYLQIFHEQQNLEFVRQSSLESQLKCGQITVKEFIRGLITSDAFYRLNYEVNNNYRFVDLCFQRVLGRQVYGEREQLAWSIVLATKGVKGLIAGLLESAEYMDTFGEYIVPYQRRRILPQRAVGAQTFAHTARYGTDYRDKLPRLESFTLYRASPSSDSKFILNFGPQEKRLLAIAILTLILASVWLVVQGPEAQDVSISWPFFSLDQWLSHMPWLNALE